MTNCEFLLVPFVDSYSSLSYVTPDLSLTERLQSGVLGLPLHQGNPSTQLGLPYLLVNTASVLQRFHSLPYLQQTSVSNLENCSETSSTVAIQTF